ncbi:amino acid transporter AVT1I-like [Spinacia oleracea]|uniref:Amino acid transporter AVT1I-like n=1 Tax=Spinacia oleracea TaxID=3562 RepID=A0ABM3QPA9_SPIOL|nr:amino acid transporter AVT1I-like [Spinacia oleracea]
MEVDRIIRSSSEGHTSLFKTVFNGLNTILGVGILSMPYALASGGWLSLIVLFSISGAACYSALLTKRCMDANPSIKSYDEIGEFAFGKLGKRVLSIVLYLDLYMALTGYLILEGDNLHDLFPNVKTNFHGISIGGNQTFVMIIAVAFLPTVWLEDLSVLAYISATGVISGVVILASVLWVGVFDGVGFHCKGELINWKGITTAMSLYMFSYSANPVFPTLYTSIKKKHQFSKVLLIGFFCATICYASMAILGYMMFGSALQSQITLNLPTHKLSSKIAIYTAWISPLSKYALLMEPLAATTESWFPNYQNKKWFKMLLRTSLVVSQVVIALTIPFFGSLMSLAGALMGATSSITIPCLCYLKISRNNRRNNRRSTERIFIKLLSLMSIVIVVLGTYTSLRNIIKESIRHHKV